MYLPVRMLNPSCWMHASGQSSLLQAHISMRAAVLSPDSIMKLMRTNLHDPKADLDTSSSDTTGLEQHWQQVTVRDPPLPSFAEPHVLPLAYAPCSKAFSSVVVIVFICFAYQCNC